MKTISGQTPDVRQGSIVAMSITAARCDPVSKKDDPRCKIVHPGHQEAQDSMREAKTCRCSADIFPGEKESQGRAIDVQC